MAYKKSKETKNRIIEACRELFYKNGYVATTYQDLSEKLNISKGLIHYHFPNKKDMSSVVFNDFLIHNKAFISALLKDKYDLQIITAVEIRNYMDLFSNNQNMNRFYYELCKDRVMLDSILIKETGEYFYQIHNKTYYLNLSDSVIKIINISYAATEIEVNINYFDGYLDEPYENLIDFNIKTLFELMSLDCERIKEIIKISRDIYSRMEIRMKDYFQLELVAFEGKNKI